MADLDSMSMRDIIARTVVDIGSNNYAQRVSVTDTITTTSTKLKASYVASTTATYSIVGNYIEIDNQGAETIILTVNSISIQIKAGYIFASSFEEFNTFTVTVPTTCAHQILVGDA